MTNAPATNGKNRITSLDALRAFTLLGILIVHANNGFGFSFDGIHSSLDYFVFKVNEFFLSNKCNTIFAALFGVSFYLILRNPKNSSAKFVWRCFLLALIGLFNKLFYSFDALMWYGIWGMVLVMFRNVKPNLLIITCILCLLLDIFLGKFHIGDLLFGQVTGNRYGPDKSFSDVFFYSSAVTDYCRIVLNGGIFDTLAKFIFGYWIAKIGFIENLKEKVTKRFLIITWVAFIVLFSVNMLLRMMGSYYVVIRSLSHYSASIAYASALVYVYYNSNFCNRILRLFEPYGRLGLTNYSVGGILGVIFINEFGLGLYKYPLTLVVLFFVGLFLIQAVFSYYWLRCFTYGPMEYVWRVATERKRIPFLRNSAAKS